MQPSLTGGYRVEDSRELQGWPLVAGCWIPRNSFVVDELCRHGTFAFAVEIRHPIYLLFVMLTSILRSMPTPRANQVDLSITPYYHCIARCVRRAFLCGKDTYSGQNFEHRREWVRERLRFLAGVFAIDICAYAVMSNHLHVVLHVDAERAGRWSDGDVVERYCKLHPMAKEDYEFLPPAKQRERRETWRTRLCDLSWMMRSLNEFIARRANKEDDVSGRFWEGRFKSQALLDEQGLLTCMAYVDLNPVRAGLARTLEESDFASIQERLQDLARKRRHHRRQTAPDSLVPFAEQHTDSCTAVELAPTLEAYVELLEWTGRAVAKKKQGKIVGPPPKLLVDQGVSAERWVAALAEHKVGTVSVLGSVESVQTLAEKKGKGWLRGLGLAKRCAA